MPAESDPSNASGAANDGLAARLTHIHARMAAAARRVGRDPAEVRLLPVTKTFDAAVIRAAVALGLTRLGENKVQEIQSKHAPLADCGIDWVMIGHLQTNKVKQVVPLVTEIQSLDRVPLAVELDRRAQALGRSMDVLVQVKTSSEPSKYGLPPEELAAFVRTVARDMPSLRIQGLMTLAIHTQQAAAVRQCFRTLRELRDRLRAEAVDGVQMQRLSMGMSGDFELGIEEGATEVRVGTALFGDRTYELDYWPEPPPRP